MGQRGAAAAIAAATLAWLAVPAPAEPATGPRTAAPVPTPAPTAAPTRSPALPSAPAAIDLDAPGLADVLASADAAGGDLGPRLRARLPRWRELVPGDELTWQLDAERRLVLASALTPASRERVRAEIASVVDAALPLLFGAPPADPVLVVVAEGRLARDLVAGEARVAGRYVHIDRILAVREIGVSLRHELIHALHFGHMERMGMRAAHPFWIQEGLATLFETWARTDDAGGRFEPSDRDGIPRRLADANALDGLAELAALDGRSFMRSARRHYAVARAVMRWLAERGALADWYRRLGDAPSPGAGLDAMAAALGLEREALDEAFRDWLRARPVPTVAIEPGGPWLGLQRVDEDPPDGVQVLRVVPRGPARRAGLRPGDVVLEVNGAVSPTAAELDRLVARHRPGETVRLTVRRRGSERIELDFVLGTFDPGPARRRGRGR